ncbi:MAG: DUF3718 domain-containing protein [Paraglaciecola sp.]|uniref:DUF3718 domain-containing protein n=1 Tax=Paraglaciecola sp. TaxID=1920173 RepID=UPI003267FAE2
MLKTVKMSITIACITALSSGYAQANIGETFENNCTIVKADNKGELGKKLKHVKPDFKSKLKEHYANISCNDGNNVSRSTILNSAALYDRF